MSEPRMIQDIQRDEDNEEVVKFLVERIDYLESQAAYEPISFTKAGFIGYTLFVCTVTVVAVWFIIA